MPPPTQPSSPPITTRTLSPAESVKRVRAEQDRLRLEHARLQREKAQKKPTGPSPQSAHSISQKQTEHPSNIPPKEEDKPKKSKAWLWSLSLTTASTLVAFAVIAAVFATVAAPILPAFLMGLGAVFGALALAAIVAGGVMLIGTAITSGLAYVNRTKEVAAPDRPTPVAQAPIPPLVKLNASPVAETSPKLSSVSPSTARRIFDLVEQTPIRNATATPPVSGRSPRMPTPGR